jgi:hypothetical protein
MRKPPKVHLAIAGKPACGLPPRGRRINWNKSLTTCTDCMKFEQDCTLDQICTIVNLFCVFGGLPIRYPYAGKPCP